MNNDIHMSSKNHAESGYGLGLELLTSVGLALISWCFHISGDVGKGPIYLSVAPTTGNAVYFMDGDMILRSSSSPNRSCAC
jgi:hypothetical protein